GADAGAARKLGARLKERYRGIVIDGFGMERFHEAERIGDSLRMRQKLADPGAAFSMLRELVFARRDGEARLSRGHARQPLPAADRIGMIGLAPIGPPGFATELIHLLPSGRLKHVQAPC